MKWTDHKKRNNRAVGAPLAGAWIEIDRIRKNAGRQRVAPLAGAWIEIIYVLMAAFDYHVAPLAGAWIEILESYVRFCMRGSLPSRERGLK